MVELTEKLRKIFMDRHIIRKICLKHATEDFRQYGLWVFWLC